MSLDNTTYHIPVLLEEAIAEMAIRPDGTYCDLTLGGGGHSAAAGATVTGSLNDGKAAILRAIAQVTGLQVDA